MFLHVILSEAKNPSLCALLSSSNIFGEMVGVFADLSIVILSKAKDPLPYVVLTSYCFT